jgi:hypothetical protein
MASIATSLLADSTMPCGPPRLRMHLVFSGGLGTELGINAHAPDAIRELACRATNGGFDPSMRALAVLANRPTILAKISLRSERWDAAAPYPFESSLFGNKFSAPQQRREEQEEQKPHQPSPRRRQGLTLPRDFTIDDGHLGDDCSERCRL